VSLSDKKVRIGKGLFSKLIPNCFIKLHHLALKFRNGFRQRSAQGASATNHRCEREIPAELLDEPVGDCLVDLKVLYPICELLKNVKFTLLDARDGSWI
jgi:hypothetical protein